MMVLHFSYRLVTHDELYHLDERQKSLAVAQTLWFSMDSSVSKLMDDEDDKNKDDDGLCLRVDKSSSNFT